MAESPPEIVAAARPGTLYRTCRMIVRAFLAVYFRWRVHDRGNVPAVGPVILASNHVSYIDPPLVGCALDRAVHFLARKTLFENRAFGPLIRKLNAVPVDRDGGGGTGLKTLLERLDTGAGIVLFPEGTRSRDGELKPAKAGIGLVVIKSDAPVVPVRIYGAYQAWGRQRIVPAPRRIDVVFGRPIDFSALRAEAKACDKTRLKAIYQEAADEIMRAIGAIESPRN